MTGMSCVACQGVYHGSGGERRHARWTLLGVSFGAEIRAQAQNPSIRTTAMNSNPFTRGYTDAERASGWRKVDQGRWIADQAILGVDVAVCVREDRGTP